MIRTRDTEEMAIICATLNERGAKFEVVKEAGEWIITLK